MNDKEYKKKWMKNYSRTNTDTVEETFKPKNKKLHTRKNIKNKLIKI